jgi:hypothetical protein
MFQSVSIQRGFNVTDHIEEQNNRDVDEYSELVVDRDKDFKGDAGGSFTALRGFIIRSCQVQMSYAPKKTFDQFVR